ncbi:PLP-dependent aminotransferase family protein [Paenibacillus sp. J5C_2022]|uniref:MocR-like pyridoxine biosynthesis transcription factor PdxR n=1 Tax=Paenibacillus sp. J5C2022 TaxID=2977129 RepID=UPI0021D34EB7|nr:PLP-dependent aminotransferase family protein [Paenibacillus sp. J5C2022]MCU6707241.1 PLP-dependent aminotransferase family protein [Paenibacillus sp. J5C2022]
MNISMNRELSVPIYQQIKMQIQSQIWNGSLQAGSKLPPERKLAEQLGVNRSTVLRAYQELKAEGWVNAVVGRGTIVEERSEWSKALQRSRLHSASVVPQAFLRNPPLERDLIKELLSMPAGPDHYSFALGKPAAACMPVERLQSHLAGITTEQGHRLFQHCPTHGYAPLRETVSKWMQGRGAADAAVEEVLIVSGAQQGLDLVARVMIEQGDIVFVEEPTYFSAVQLFRLYGARIMTMPSDGRGGLQLDFLEAMLMKHAPKFIYVQPTFQNPTGRVLSFQQRKGLMELAERYGTYIVEEDPYYELRYSGETIPALKSMDAAGQVIYIGSYSKLLSPGLRVGWVYAPAEITDAMARWKQYMDLHSSPINQALIDSFIRSGDMERHLAMCRQYYKRNRDDMAVFLQAYERYGWSFRLPEGGFFLWLRLPEELSATVLLLRAMEKEVSFAPGAYFSFDGRQEYRSCIRLNFSWPLRSQMEEGLARLHALSSGMLEEQRGSARPGRSYHLPFV